MIRQPHVQIRRFPNDAAIPRHQSATYRQTGVLPYGRFLRDVFRRCGRSGKTFGYYPDHARTGGWRAGQNGRRAVSRRRTISGAPGQVGQKRGDLRTGRRSRRGQRACGAQSRAHRNARHADRFRIAGRQGNQPYRCRVPRQKIHRFGVGIAAKRRIQNQADNCG